MSAKTTKSARPQTGRRAAAKPGRKKGTPGEDGRLTGPETTNLVLQAKEAFHYQIALGKIEPGTDVNDWRRDQVMDCVGKAGTSKLIRSDWRPVMAHFLTLSGREDEALEVLSRTGLKSYRPADGADTWETCETYVELIRQALDDHSRAFIVPFRYIEAGWLIAAARQRTGKPTLTMATFAERLDPKTLHGLLSHLRNHIAVREGRAVPERRKERVYPEPADPGEMDDPF